METTEALNRAISQRRSIYTSMYSGGRVDDTIIDQMLENANWAPTHKKTEPWRFVVFQGDGLEEFATFQADAYKQRTLDGGTFDEAKYNKLLNNPRLCSHIIAIGMQRHEVVPEVEEVCAVACAVQNMWLTASAYGVGCYWSTGGVTFYDGIQTHFGWGENDKLLGFLYIGELKSDQWPVGIRKPVGDKVQWVGKHE